MKRSKGHLIKRGKVWHLCWVVDGRQFWRSTKCTSKAEAEKAAQSILEPFMAKDETRILENIANRIEGRKAEIRRLEDEANPPLSIQLAWPAYEGHPDRPDSGDVTLGNYRSWWKAFRAWLEATHPEAATLRDVTPDMARTYAQSLTTLRGLSPNSFNKHTNFLALFFRVLKDKARIESNPFEGIKRKRLVTQNRRELTTAELRTVCERASGEMRLLFAVGVYTGLRLGDCATLKWNETDLERRIIRRIPNKTARRNPKPVLIPIHAVLAALLEEIPRKGRNAYVLPTWAAMYLRDTSAASKRIHDHFESCGIQTHRDGTGKGTDKRAVVDVGFHSLRHTFVSLCREGNAPLAVVESIVGHSSPAMTRHYTHTGEEAAALAVNSLPSVMGETPALPAADPVKELCERIRELREQLDVITWRDAKKRMRNALG
jgi:integrase